MLLAKYSLDNTKIIYFFLAVLLIGGIFSFGKLGKKEDAPFVIKSAVIMTRYAGAEPTEVERLITEPISREIQSMSGVYKIKSESMYGLSKITFELQPSLPASSIPQKWDELRRKVLNIQPQLPNGASIPTISDDFGDVFGIYYGLTADDGFTYEEMRNWAERIKTQVVTADGVMKVALFGVQTEVVNIFISTNRLVGMGIDPKQLASLLQSQNQIINTGEIRAGVQQLRVTANGMYTSIDDIRNQVITTKAGQVQLGDIAVIEKGYLDPPSTIMHVNGKRAIGIGISTDPQRDVVQTGVNVNTKLDELLPLMPVGLELESLYLENEIANEANNGFIINLIESILIVIFIIMLVMGLRAGVLIGSSLIFSISGTLLIMSFFGVGLNRTSLAGFIIAMGMLVDNAIVVTDNAQIAIARGVNRRLALIDGATRPQWGLLGATFIAICSFLPLYLAPSAVAEIVKPLFVVLAISLGLSWVLALTQTTVFGNFILKAKAKDNAKDPYDKPFYHKFASILGVLIRNKAVTLVGVVVLFIISLIVMGAMPQNFFPSLDKPYFRADVFYPDGYSIQDVVKEMKSVEEHLSQKPEVKKVSITFGSTPLRYYLASTSVGPKPNFANILVELTDSKYTKEYEEEFDGYMRANYPNAITRTSLFKLSPAVDAAIEIGFIGPNVDTLVALTDRALEIMHQNPDLINIRNSWGNKIPVWKPVYSPERAQPLGVSRQGMAQSIQIGTTGMTLGEYRQGDQVLPILLKDNTVDSFHINDMRTVPVFGAGNETTSLEQVVSGFDFQYRFSNVKVYNRQMVMMAQCDPRRGVNATAAFNQVWTQVQEEIEVPEGYTMKYFGEQESQVESNEALAKNLPLTFFLMFTTLLFLFKTYRKPTVILLMLPLIFIGVVLGLLVLGKSFDFFSILGLLGLIGMNIKNAIVLVDQIDLETAAGKKPLDAVISATTSRIVPVAMASGTTILGMLPLLFDAMFGGMAATIMGGLLVASALTLFVLPVAYSAIHRIKARFIVLPLLLFSLTGQAQQSYLTREAYREKVEAYSQQLKQQRLRTIAGTETRKITRTGFLPRIDINAEGTLNLNDLHAWNEPVGEYRNHTYQGIFVVSQPLYTGGALNARYRIAQADEHLELLNEELTLDQIHYQSDAVYWNASASQAMLRAAYEYQNIIRQQHDIIQDRFNDGMISRTDLLMISTRLKEAELQYIRARENHTLALQRLNILMGIAPNAPVDSLYDIGVSSTPVRVLSLEDVLLRRPDYAGTEVNILRSEAQRLAALSEFNPQLSMYFSGGWATATPNLGYDVSFNPIIGVSLNIPVFRWGARSKTSRQQRAYIGIQRLQQSYMEDVINEELSAALTKLSEAEYQVKTATENLNLANENLDLVTFSYNEGKANMVDVLSAQLSWTQAHTNLINAYLSEKMAVAEYRRVISE